MSDTYPHNGGLTDRVVYLIANAQMLVAGVLVSVAVALIWFRPTPPGMPPWAMGVFAGFLLLGPPMFGFFVWLAGWLRERHMVEVHHVDARHDVLEKYKVAPEIWSEKKVEGPSPYPVNGSAAWAVQSFEWDADLEQLRVKGVWLSEIEDTKLLTSKKHFNDIFGRLSESHIALAIYRDSTEQFGADIQHKLTNLMVEAREKGKLMDPNAVSAVFEEFEEDIEGLGADDLPTLELEGLEFEDETALADEVAGEVFQPTIDQPAVADGGSENQ